MRRISGAAVLLLLAAASTSSAQEVELSRQPAISTRGEAALKRAPDQAFVTIAAESRATVPADAQRQNAEAMQSVMTALSKAGLPSDAVRTTGFSLQPDIDYTGGRQRVRGYIARNQIEARVDDLRKLGGVIDSAGTSGATTIAGLRFDLKDRDEAERDALKLATQEAMARAKAIAQAAGRDLGQIVRIEDQYQGRQPGPMYRTAMAAGGGGGERVETPVTPGELEIRATVMLTIAIR